ncbi:3-deoxy-D-manno-octulosonic acid kinase [Pseudoalteromonas luteoviolacea B = ATCC 29581]|nr:3-deoxy-D-manno-octulosonic acid kinase [Pseudoalteromonas luteoviolacea B = ATCC 29581]
MKVSRQGNCTLLSLDPELNVTTQWFDPKHWQALGAIRNQKQGRATAYFVEYQPSKVAVLRHYWRGGLIGKILNDQYLYCGFKQTRVFKEFNLLCTLYEQGFPVPKPIAAQVKTSAMIYRGDILTEAVPNAISLNERLQQQALDQNTWHQIAQTIAHFHRSGVFHADLNINNILFDDTQRVYLIDFDRGEQRKAEKSWQMANLERLKRSFLKEAARQASFHWHEAHWHIFLNEYLKSLKQ